MRTLTSAVQAEVDSSNARMVMLVYLSFSSGDIYLNTSPMTITYDGNDYLGVGDLGSIDTIKENSDIAPHGTKLTLNGVPSDYIAIALDEEYQGRDAYVYIGFLDTDYTLIADPIGPFQYTMDNMDINLGKTGSVTLSVESYLDNWNKPVISRYTNEEQQRLYSGDLGLEFVSKTVDKEINWGSK